MNQDVIWDHFQNEGIEAFDDAGPRLEFLVGHLQSGERALDIGVGSGGLAKRAAAKGVEVWALDPSARSIEKLRSALDLGRHAMVGHSQQIPFPDAHFDVVVMSEVLEHLETDLLRQTLVEVARVLRPDGRFIGTVPANENLFHSEVVCPACEHKFHRWGHRQSFNSTTLRQTLQAEFKNVEIEEHFFIAWEAASWRTRVNGLLKRFLSSRGIGTYGTSRNLYFTARR